MLRLASFIVVACSVTSALAGTIRVPADHITIQAGVDSASIGDTFLMGSATSVLWGTSQAAFTEDMETLGLPWGVRTVRFKLLEEGSKYPRLKHSGLDIGGNRYGQRFILSKQGAAFPVKVNTAREFSTGDWVGSSYSRSFKTQAAYGPWEY
jgi:hypothetical protein